MKEMLQKKLDTGIFYLEPGETPIHITSAGLMLCGRKKIFIDISMEGELSEQLVLRENPDILIASHYHLDHSLWLRRVEKDNREVWAPHKEEGYFSDIEHFLDGTVGYESQLRDQFRTVLKFFLKWEPVEGFRTFSEEKVDLGDFTLHIIPSPGHSPGHSAFYIPERKILFCCDIGVGQYGPWYGWRDSSILEHVDSVLRLRTIEAQALVSSHDGIFTNPYEKLTDLLREFFIREAKISEALEKGISREKLVEDGIYFKSKHKVSEPQRTFITVQDENMLNHHMKVIQEGGLRTFFPDIWQEFEKDIKNSVST